MNTQRVCSSEFSGLTLSTNVTFLSFNFISESAPLDSNFKTFVLFFHPFMISNRFQAPVFNEELLRLGI